MQNRQQYVTLAKLPSVPGFDIPSDTDLEQVITEHQGNVITMLAGTLGRYDYVFVAEFPSMVHAQKALIATRLRWGLITESITGTPAEQFQRDVLSQTKEIAGNRNKTPART